MELADMSDNIILRSIQMLQEYLSALNHMTNRLILISVKDTPGFKFNDDLYKRCEALGLKVDLRKKHWHGYVGVIYNHSSIREILAEKGECAEMDYRLQTGECMHLVSKPFPSGNLSKIEIDGKDYSVNKRGLNIVVYDVVSHYVIDSVSFDTHIPSFPCRRNLVADPMQQSVDACGNLAKMVQKQQTKLVNMECLLFHINHRFLEERARRKLQAGMPLKVFFIVDDAAKFPSGTIYEEMEKKKAFEPYIFIVHAYDKAFYSDPEKWNETKRSFAWFQDHGYRTIFGYNEDRRPIGLESFSPDILFIQNPNLGTSLYQPLSMNYNFLTCYISYGMGVVNIFSYHYEYLAKNISWKIFSQHRLAHEMAVSKASTHGLNYVLSGYPRLDLYRRKVPCRKHAGRKKVIVAPHWSIRRTGEAINMAVFHLYHKNLMGLLDEFPDIDFCFKPHPELRNRIRQLDSFGADIGLTLAEYERYLVDWENHENGSVMHEGNYIDLFMESDALITDCGSFIAEYLLSGHPCIYMLNPEKNMAISQNYNALGVKILSTYYLCASWEEIYKSFVEVVVQGNDTQKEAREKVASSEFVNVGVAGKFIADYVERILMEPLTGNVSKE